nr:tail tape measure protein [Acinetobacter oleivorans]
MADSDHNNSVLSYDELGFIIGMKRVEKKVSTIDLNIEKIIEILTQSFEEQKAQFAKPQPKLTEFQKMLNAVNNRPALDFEDLLKEKTNPITQSFVVADKFVKDFADVLEQSVSDLNSANKEQINQPKARKPAIEINSHEDLDKIVSSTTPERDEKGRFVSNNNDAQNQSSIRKVAQKITTAIKGIMPNSPQGVDPTVDAINEVGHLLSPVRRAAGLALRPLTGLMRSKKRNEPLPREQENHNRKQIKLLQRIADNLASKGGLLGSLGKLLTSALSAGGGLLGGVLGKGKKGVGKLGKGLGKLLKFGRGLPVIGALAAGASLLDWNEQSTQEKGGTVGSLAGGVIGGTVGSLFGPAGTLIGGMAGSWIGNKLGTAVAPYFKEWTDSLIAADVPGIINTAWKGFVSYASNAFDQAKGTTSKVVEGVKDTAGDTLDFIKDKFNRFNPFHDGVPTWGVGQGVYKPGFGANKNVPAYGAASGGKGGKFNGFGVDIDQYIKESSQRYGIDEKTLRGFVKIEDGWSGKMSPTGAIGTGQFTQGTWDDLAKTKEGQAIGMSKIGNRFRTKNDPRFDKRVNTLATGLLAKQNAERLKKAGLEVTGENLYMLHNIGPGVIPALQGRNSVSAKTIEAMRNNGMQSNESPVAFAQRQKNKFQQHYNLANSVSVEAKTVSKKESKPPENIFNETRANMKQAFATKTAVIPRAEHVVAASTTKNQFVTSVPSFKQPLNTPNPQEVVVVNQNNGNIGQNVNDRFLAHALTGGIGMYKNEA